MEAVGALPDLEIIQVRQLRMSKYAMENDH